MDRGVDLRIASDDSFEEARPRLLTLSYRMLGDRAASEDILHEAWIRWAAHRAEVRHPRAFLFRTVTNLCLNYLESAAYRKEQARPDWLPEPIAIDEGLETVELADQISMAFVHALSALSPRERAVVILHDVFDYAHGEIGDILKTSEGASRQLLRRAKVRLRDHNDEFHVDAEQHQRLLEVFLRAAQEGDVNSLVTILRDDAVLTADGGIGTTRYGRVRQIGAPIIGAQKVAHFVAAVTAQGASGAAIELRKLNGQPAVVLSRDGAPDSVLMISVKDGRISRVFVHADPRRRSWWQPANN